MNNLGMILAARSASPEAEKWQLRAWHTAQQSLPPGHWRTLVFERDYGSTSSACGASPRPSSTSWPAIARCAAFGPAHRRTTVPLRALGNLYEAWGWPDETAALPGAGGATAGRGSRRAGGDGYRSALIQ